MPLYIWKENWQLTVSSCCKEAPIGAQIIITTDERVEEILNWPQTPTTTVKKEYPEICEKVLNAEEKVKINVQSLLAQRRSLKRKRKK